MRFRPTPHPHVGRARSRLGTIRFQVQLALSCIAVAVIATGVVMVLVMRDLVGGFSEAYGELSDEAMALQQLRSTVLTVDAEASQLAVARSPEHGRRLALAVREVNDGFAALEGETLTEEGVAVQRAEALWKEVQADLTVLGDSPAGESSTDAGPGGVTVPSSTIRDAVEQLEIALDHSLFDAELELQTAHDEYRWAVMTMVGSAAVVLLLLLLGRRILVRSALDPLADLSATAARVGAGDLTARTSVAGGAEVRDVTTAFNMMAADVEKTHIELALGASRDPLTGLMNRRFVKERLDGLASAGAGFALLVVDLDDFKAANDTGGHVVGDVLLCAVAERFRQLVRGDDVIARLGGDEFALVVANGQLADAEALAERVVQALSAPHDYSGRRYTVTASLGIAMSMAGSSVEDLLGNADMAMYAAKQAGRSQWVVFDESMRTHEIERLALIDDLRKAIERDEFEVHYQPIVDVTTGSVDRLEALVRWRHPARGLIAPDRFIPEAEEANLIVAIGTRVLRQACSDAMRFSVRSGRPIGVAVNVSPHEVRLGDRFVHAVTASLAHTGLSAGQLTVEITESAFLDDVTSPVAIAALQELRRLGVRVSIDDFGTGHSSLSRLCTLPVDELKIDRSFIAETTQSHVTGSIVGAITTMARLLGLTVVAEGVEDDQQRQAVISHGCHHAQGYLFSPPVPAPEVGKLLDHGNSCRELPGLRPSTTNSAR